MSSELKVLQDGIWHCTKCSELETKVPLLFMPNTQVKIMVVTQGPKGETTKDKIDEIKKGVLSPANFFMYPFLYTMFNGEFRPDGEIDEKPSTAYWTHMRKCFMEGKEGDVPDICSGGEDSYLREEIRIVNPKLIIAVGKWAARFFAEYDDRLRSELERGFGEAFLQQKGRFYRLRSSEQNVDADLVIVPHPSGQNARLWKKLGEDGGTRIILENIRKRIKETISEK